MSKELNFGDGYDEVKYLDNSTNFDLVLTTNGAAFNLTQADEITVKIANDSGYIMSKDIDPSTITNPENGEFFLPVDDSIMDVLTPDDYYIEVWLKVNPVTPVTDDQSVTLTVDNDSLEEHQSIFPSTGLIGFTIDDNINSDTGEVIPVINFDQFEDQFDDMMAQMQDTVSNVKKGDKGDTGAGLEIKDKVSSISNLPPTANEGDGYLVGEELYVRVNNSWKDCGLIQGPKGDQGIQGIQGNTGTGISSTTIQYQISSSATTAPTGIWSNNIVATTTTNPYLWMKATLNYGDNTTKDFYLVSQKGDKGDTGLTGPVGPIGPRGPIGSGLVVKGTVTDASQLPKIGNQEGYCYFVGTDLYVWDAGAWKNCGSVSQDLSNYVTIADLNNGLSTKVTDNKNGTIEVNGSSITPADDSKVVHSTDMRKPASDVAGIEEVNAKQDKIAYTPADDSKVVHSTDMRKPASDVAGIEEVNAKQDKIGYTPADDSKVVHSTDALNWQKHKLTADDGSAKLVIASGEDVNEKLKAIVGTKDTGKLLVDINAKNNPTGHSLIGEYSCDFDGLVTGYGIGQDGTMWGFTYSGATTLWKLILIAKKPGIPSLAVKYNAGKKAFDYALTAPEKDGLSDIIQYNLLWKDHSVDDWTTVIVKPDSLTGQLTGVGIKKTYDFKASAQNAVGASGFTDVITLGTAVVPGIPSLAVKYNAGKKGFDYTVTAPKSDGGSEITGYSLEYQKQGGGDWTKTAIKPSSLTGAITDGTKVGSNYVFRVNAENEVGSSNYFTVSHPVSAVDGSIYGASWDGSSSGILQRTDAAVGLKAGINGAQNDFDTRGPWGLMDKTVKDSYGNAFVRVPKFYIRKAQDKSKPLSTWQVSLVKQGADWYLPNCFYDFDNKKELAYVDVSRYEGFIDSGYLKSKSGANPTVSTDINDFRNAAVANNADGKKGYHLWDVHTLDALQVLFTIEFATLDSQSIMEGNDAGSSAISNGTTDNVKGSSGFAASGAAPMTYRGIENLYGNLAMWTDGLNITNLSLYSCDDATKYVSDTFTDPYYEVSYQLISSSGQNITGLGFDKNHPGVTAPTSFNSDSYNTYYHDEGYISGSGNYVVYTGGSWDWNAGSSGLWCWYSDCSSANVYSGVGSRLLKKAL